MAEKNKLHFKFAGKVARLLGRESVSSPIVALFELIKNSYDADSKRVKVEFKNLLNPVESSIEIIDWGDGMNLQEFESRWMIVGTDDKEVNPYSRGGRRKVGEKGLGRFSMERLGSRASIITKKVGIRNVLNVDIDWDSFEKKDVTFDEVGIDYFIRKTKKSWKGFKVIISHLRDVWTKEMVEEFIKEASILNPPKEISKKFNIQITSSDYNIDLKELDNYLFNEAQYTFNSEYDGKKNISYALNGKTLYGNKKNDIKIKDEIEIEGLVCGKVKFVMYFYPLGRGDERFYAEPNRKQISDSLGEIAGVKIYRDSFRVKPYGDNGNDWLELSHKRLHLRHLKYPDNNQVIGYVIIHRDDNLIVDTTTREGLIKNKQYYDLIEFLEISLKSFASLRKELEKKPPSDFKNLVKETKVTLTSSLEQLDIDKTSQREIQNIFKKVTGEAYKEINLEKEQKELYRNLASLGIVAGYSVHEISPLIDSMNTIVSDLKDDENITDIKIHKQLDRLVSLLENNVLFVNLILGYIKKDKRKRRKLNIIEIIEYLFKHFGFLLMKFKIDYEIKNNLRKTDYKIFRIDLESIFMNMIINSVYFLKYRKERKILVELKEDPNDLIILFHDSGTGVPKKNWNKIFNYLFTTKKSDGTGLGLTIVKELIEYYGGKITVIESQMSGLSLYINIPKGNLK